MVLWHVGAGVIRNMHVPEQLDKNKLLVITEGIFEINKRVETIMLQKIDLNF
jgi:hypothetical protein